MSDISLRDAALAELKLTTVGWNKVKNYSPAQLATTHWGKAMSFLEQIGAAPPPPPPPPAGDGWGTFDSAAHVWPTASWRPFSDTSPFNKPVSASSTVHANSAALISRLLEGTPTGPGHLTAGAPSVDDYAHPVVYSQPSDPLYTIHCIKYASDDLEGKQVRIPMGTQPAGGGDGHLCVVDQATGFAYDLYEASVPNGSGGTLDVGSGGVTRVVEPNATGVSLDLDGDGRIGGATAPHFGLLAGIIRAEELQAGQINHALFITIPCGSSSPSYVPPAQKGDRFCADNTNRIPMGARLRYNMTVAEINALSIPDWKKTILRAMSQHGMYFGDTGGPGSFGVAAESDATYTAFGVPSRMVDFAKANGWTLYNGYYVGHLRDGVPWNRLQVLNWNDPANR